MARWLAAAMICTALAGGARADRVWLTNGNYLEGTAVVLPDGQVEIRSTLGSLSLPAEKVLRIERSETIEAEVERALAEIEAGDAEAIYQLALWCESRGAHTLASRLLRETINQDPDHAGAREALGYRLLDGSWVTEEEWHELRGEVLFRGEWMRPEARSQILQLETLQAQAEAERQRQRAFMAQLRYEAELSRRAQSTVPTGIPYLPWGYGPGIVVLPSGGALRPPLVAHPPRVDPPPRPSHPVALPPRPSHPAASPAQHYRSSFRR